MQKQMTLMWKWMWKRRESLRLCSTVAPVAVVAIRDATTVTATPGSNADRLLASAALCVRWSLHARTT